MFTLLTLLHTKTLTEMEPDNLIPSKRCTKCKNEFQATLEFWSKEKLGRYGLKSVCKSCVPSMQKFYNSTQKSKETRRIYLDKLKSENKQYKRTDKAKENKRIYEAKCRSENPTKAREKDRRIREQISDCYIAQNYGMKVKDIPSEEMELRRVIIKLKREIKSFDIVKIR